MTARLVMTPNDGSAHALIALTGADAAHLDGEWLLFEAMPALVALNAMLIAQGLPVISSDDCLIVAAPADQWSTT